MTSLEDKYKLLEKDLAESKTKLGETRSQLLDAGTWAKALEKALQDSEEKSENRKLAFVELQIQRDREQSPTHSVNRREILPAKSYDCKGDLLEFLKQFEQLATLQSWTEERKRVILISKLENEALSAVAATDCSSYDSVVLILKKTFASTDTSVYTLKLSSRQQKKGEELNTLAWDIQKLGKKAYPTADEKTLDELNKEHFINALTDESLRVMVRFKDPTTLQDALKMAERIAAHSDQEKRLVKRNVVKVVDDRTEMAEKDEEIKHLSERLAKLESSRPYQADQKADSQKKQKSKKTGRTPPKCWKCNLPGHVQRYCPFDPHNPRMQGASFPVPRQQMNPVYPQFPTPQGN